MDYKTMQQAIETALEAIDHIVKSDGPYMDKKDAVLKAMDEELRNSFYEFLCWFEGDDSHG